MTLVHWLYLGVALLVMVALILRKEIVLPCILGIFLIGLAYTQNVISAVSILYNSVVVSATELLGIIIVIALITTLSKGLASLGSDELMIRPMAKLIRGRQSAFFIVGAVMLVFSWFLWPSPAVALIGALLLPVAIKAGLPAIWVAVSMNIFGHGIGLSSDFFIQGAPSITAGAAGVDTNAILLSSVPVWATMSLVIIAVSYVFFRRDMKALDASSAAKGTASAKAQAVSTTTQAGQKTGASLSSSVPASQPTESLNSSDGAAFGKLDVALQALGTAQPANPGEQRVFTPFAKFIAVLTPFAFVLDIVLMIVFELRGGDATALVGGTALLLLSIIMVFRGDFLGNLDVIADYVREGFQFALKIFAPVVVIAAFFFLGNGEIALKVFGEGAPNILGDVSFALSNSVAIGKIPAVGIETLVAIITGMDGSGFSGLPIVGSIAQAFGVDAGFNVAALAALGQAVTVWVGGGTIIPWGVIPVAAICDVPPADLARKNLIPVACGILAAAVVTVFLI
ncbi:MAG: hypothetical protein LBU48_00295 [Coriobacteriales bacterium]|jgi:hypothetical protein|nr:hypothetical protein [Coriobacteriales bacterium]